MDKCYLNLFIKKKMNNQIGHDFAKMRAISLKTVRDDNERSSEIYI